MTCRELAEFLSDYIDGALQGEALAVFERHLAVCPECRVYLKSFESTVAIGRVAFDESCNECPQPPAELVEAILAGRRAINRAAIPNANSPATEHEHTAQKKG